ncbi:MAG: hypothetical protein RXS42_08725 [Nitrososphaeria archaeon]
MGEEAVGFNYLDENVWVQYADEVLLPVYAKASAILDAWRDARERLNGRKLSELLGDEGIARVLLGGVKEDGSRPDNSVAGFYAGVLGINSGAGNDYYRQYIEAARRGLSPGIQVSVADAGSVPFLSFVKFIQENAGAAYYRVTGRRPEPRPERVDFARLEELAEAIRSFAEAAVRLTAAYDERTFFLWSLRTNTRRYLRAAYPRLADPGNLKWLNERLRLGIEPLGILELPEPFREDYELIGYPRERTTSGYVSPRKEIKGTNITLYSPEEPVSLMNDAIWYFFHPDVYNNMPLKLMMETPNPLRTYVEAYRAQMSFASLKQYTRSYMYKTDPKLPDMLDRLSPAQFVGFVELLDHGDRLSTLERGKEWW